MNPPLSSVAFIAFTPGVTRLAVSGIPTAAPGTTPLRTAVVILSVLVAWATPTGIPAQAGTAAPPPAASRSPGSIVSRIEIDHSDVFDTTESSAWYARGANKLHINTREDIILREALFAVGEPFDSAKATESVRNLRKLGVFSAVALDTVRDTALVVRIHTQDAWTTKPFISFKSSGDQAIWGFGIKEQNLLGRLINIVISYYSDPDRITKKLAVSAPRILSDRVTLAGLLEQYSDGFHDSAAVALPFLSLSGRKSAFVTSEKFDGDVLQYFEGEETASDTLKRRYDIVRAEFARALRANDEGYLRVGLGGQYRRDDFAPLAVAGSIDRTITAAISGYAEWDRASFIVVQNFRNLGPDEDIDLSTTARAGVSFAPSQWGYDRGGVGPLFNLRAGRKISSGFVTLSSIGTSLIGSDGLDSGTVTVDVTSLLLPRPRHSLILHADVGWSENPVPGSEFDLGLTRGPRAFPAHAFTGDRSFVTTAEYKWVVLPDIKNIVSAALAGFVDYGGAWYKGSPRRTGADLGIGVRIGSSRLPSVQGSMRLDLARRFANDVEPSGWVVVFGSGLSFERVK